MFEPETRVPFEVLVIWTNYLLNKGQFAEAESLIKGYISSSSVLSDAKTQVSLAAQANLSANDPDATTTDV